MAKPWFDENTGHILFDEYVADSPTFQAITRDHVISEEVLTQQAERVVGLFRQLHSKLQPEVQELVRETICEFAVLHAIHAKFQETAWRH
ncbi:MAG: hypothetical protein WB630_12530 [Candidatus Acidiferrales bacterium]